MATITPFAALRPANNELAAKIAALPYDVYTTEEARKAAAGNALSFLRVDRAEIDLPDRADVYSDSVYEKARDNLNGLIQNGHLVKDQKDCLYVYQVSVNGKAQTGIVGLASVDEYLSGVIKKHELTREDKENDRIRHIEYCGAQTGPIFLAYKSDSRNAGIKTIVSDWIKTHPKAADVTFDDGVNHSVWVVYDEKVIGMLKSSFEDVPNLFIADGHHRNAAAVKVCLSRRNESNGFDGSEEFNRYLAVVFPDDELTILDYNRVVRDLNGLTAEEFMSKIKERFDVRESAAAKPERRHTFGMYIDKRWHVLKVKEDQIDEAGAQSSLDVSVLQRLVITPILGITDIRNDKRIDFIGGVRGVAEIERRVDSGEMAVGFALFPTSMDELMSVASQDKIMPPKSTWFEPKLRSGLFVHQLESF